MISKVQFTPGFEAFSGQVVKMKGKLTYAENNNPAWRAPIGKQFSTNFRPRIVLNVRKSDGSVYWSVRTKSAVDNTKAGRLRMASFGGMTAVTSAIKKDPNLLAAVYEAYALVKDNYKSFTSFIQSNVYQALKEQKPTLYIEDVTLKNPWVSGGTGTTITPSGEIARKFALQLCPASISVDGKDVAGVPGVGMSWGTFITQYATTLAADFTLEDVEDAGKKVQYKGNDLYYGSELVTENDEAPGAYTTTPANA